ncbi:MAG: hypothetical protein K6G31_06430 [Paludibacteraceae bacterium]|nr:hypothetical protein [Paludibacteraceae bacterium]
MRKIDLKRVIFTGKEVFMRYFTIIFLLFAAVFVANALGNRTGGCAYACNCKCDHHYCDCCDKCANEHHRDCECECHKDVELYWDDVNAACMSGCDDCRDYHETLKVRHDYWLKHSKKPKHQGKQNARPRQKKTTPRQPQRSSNRSAVRQQHR